MAHSRVAPPGYVEAFAPNVRILPGRKISVAKRDRVVTADDIREVERAWIEGLERARESGE
jgi:hypothetical protein